MKSSFDLIVAGAGIAGLSAAWAAHQAGLRTAVVDPAGPAAGASGVPLALLNPAPGRRARKTWRAKECMRHTLSLLRSVEEYSGVKFLYENGIARPAFDRKMAEGMIDSSRNPEWPEGWVEWLDEEEFSRRFPGVHCQGGGLWIPVGCSVRMPLFLHHLCRYLEELGVTFIFGREISQVLDDAHAVAEPEDSVDSSQEAGFSIRRHSAPVVIHATGEEMTRDPRWSLLPLHRIKGQSLTTRLTEELPYSCSVSGLGYLIQSENGEVMVGGTYEHHYHHMNPDRKGEEYLLRRLEKQHPGLSGKLREFSSWTGVRVSLPDKMPVIGRHSSDPALWIMGGLGSRGLILAPYLGKLLVGAITDGDKLPAEVSIERFTASGIKA